MHQLCQKTWIREQVDFEFFEQSTSSSLTCTMTPDLANFNFEVEGGQQPLSMEDAKHQDVPLEFQENVEHELPIHPSVWEKFCDHDHHDDVHMDTLPMMRCMYQPIQ